MNLKDLEAPLEVNNINFEQEPYLLEEIDLSDFYDLKEEETYIPQREIEISLKNNGDDVFQKQIESYYLHKQLADALLIKGEIPLDPIQSSIGIGFIDIANYSYLSKWLSPKENQLLLNGLYSAFSQVIKQKGGFLNKIEGDSLMFHFGGIIDTNISNLSEEETLSYIASNLFHTCVEIQRTCHLFNNADKLFLDKYTHPETKDCIERAFYIVSSLRSNLAMASGVDAMFQIKIRIGASIGEVSIGNFGPKGKKQWDVIGEPVIEAKRMESTAPIGGLRISESLYNLLDKNSTLDEYFNDFKNEAEKNKGEFRNIKRYELFSYKEVILKQKNNVQFRTYGVQVRPDLPEEIAKQVNAFLSLREEGVDEILYIIKYYRGNDQILQAIENTLTKNNIIINKIELLRLLSPKKYEELISKTDPEIDRILKVRYNLFNIFKILGAHQD
nr:adenylate/guanylate cyclase domain-containing protein [Spirochaetaceae bacterium]